MSSRIIVTTRKDEIADTCHKNCPVYRMRPTLDTKAPQAELVQILCEGTARKRRVVTVFGPGGSGKSILARAAYDQLTEMEHFLHKAWAMASHDNGKGLLLDILGQLGKTNVREENISQLIDILRGLLLNGRCVLLPSLLTSTDNKPMILYRLVHLFKRNTCCKFIDKFWEPTNQNCLSLSFLICSHSNAIKVLNNLCPGVTDSVIIFCAASTFVFDIYLVQTFT